MKPEIRVNIRGIVNLRLAQLNAFQEDIKVLDDDNYQRLKSNILEDGFSFSPHVFSDSDERFWILDGHQRRTVLERMQAEGYTIPIIPCMEVDAENLEHARRLVLGAASQYGKFQVHKLVEFSKRTALEPSKLVERYALPAVPFEKIIGVNAHTRNLTGDQSKEWEGMPEFDQKDKKAFRSIHIHFHDEAGLKKFAEVTGQTITEKTRYLWFPEIVIDRMADKAYEGSEE